LAARELELHEPDDGMRLARVAVDILRPIPVGPLTLRTSTLRTGKRVALLQTVMESGGQEVLHARGWRIAKSDASPVVADDRSVPAIPADSVAPRFPAGHTTGYLAQIDWRFVTGNFDEPGPCQVWARPQIPLLPAAALSPMCRALLMADSGSGVSMTLDPTRYLFINVDLTVILHRDPAGEWLLLDAVTAIGGTGTGLAETTLCDAAGAAGVCIQTLLVAPR
jgi:hypothetical protein